jgi:hypothetical protein
LFAGWFGSKGRHKPRRRVDAVRFLLFLAAAVTMSAQRLHLSEIEQLMITMVGRESDPPARHRAVAVVVAGLLGLGRRTVVTACWNVGARSWPESRHQSLFV